MSQPPKKEKKRPKEEKGRIKKEERDSSKGGASGSMGGGNTSSQAGGTSYNTSYATGVNPNIGYSGYPQDTGQGSGMSQSQGYYPPSQGHNTNTYDRDYEEMNSKVYTLDDIGKVTQAARDDRDGWMRKYTQLDSDYQALQTHYSALQADYQTLQDSNARYDARNSELQTHLCTVFGEMNGILARRPNDYKEWKRAVRDWSTRHSAIYNKAW